MIVDVPRVDRNSDVVVLLLQGRESSNDLALLVRQQVRLLWRKPDLVLVLVRHLPLVLKRDARLILNQDGLLGRYALVDWREEQLAVVAQLQRWLVAVADQADLLHVGWIVIEDELRHEIVVARCLRIELEANEAKGLALDQADVRVRLERLRRILLNLVVSRSITRVHELDGLVD